MKKKEKKQILLIYVGIFALTLFVIGLYELVTYVIYKSNGTTEILLESTEGLTQIELELENKLNKGLGSGGRLKYEIYRVKDITFERQFKQEDKIYYRQGKYYKMEQCDSQGNPLGIAEWNSIYVGD